jgi:hypothetical protein
LHGTGASPVFCRYSGRLMGYLAHATKETIAAEPDASINANL